MRWWRARRRADPEIAPDEIFLDATNTPSFDRSRFEGRLEQPLGASTFITIAISIGVAFLILIVQSWNLQIHNGALYASKSKNNSLAKQTIFASRGAVMDMNGVVLVQNQVNAEGDTHRLYVSPGFGHLLGYVSYPKKDASGNYYDTTLTGLAGVEAAYDSDLAGQNGMLLIERDAVGNTESQGTIMAPVDGENLTLTIDVRAQKAFYRAISTLAEQVPFIGGAGILMDVESGALRALVSYPEYDPNVLTEGEPAEVIKNYSKSPGTPYLDRAIAGLYTPGSIVKPIEAAGALTDGIITPDVTVNSTGSISIPNPYDPEHPSIFKDWKALGVVDMRKAIAWSSDIYFYMVGGGYGGQKGLGIERLAYWYSTFGLTSPTGIQLGNEAKGFVPTPKWKESTFDEPWRLGDTYHTAIGQYAMQVTPIEMARAFAAIANGGKLVTPTLVLQSSALHESLPVSSAALQVVREGMLRAVSEGTSVGLSDLTFITIGGKTGTAQTGMRNEYHNLWAVGFFPYERPRYVYVVVMERGPSSNLLGGVYTMHKVISELHETAPEYFK
jgi:penicillin-binding protein 2